MLGLLPCLSSFAALPISCYATHPRPQLESVSLLEPAPVHSHLPEGDPGDFPLPLGVHDLAAGLWQAVEREIVQIDRDQIGVATRLDPADRGPEEIGLPAIPMK